jgi:translation initiation factor IF-3
MSVYKKNGKWYYKCQVFGIRKHGLCRGVVDKSQALEYEAEIKNDIALIYRGKKDKAETITLSEMLKEFMEYSETNNSEHQFIQNKHKVKVFKEFFGAETKIIDIAPLDIENLNKV